MIHVWTDPSRDGVCVAREIYPAHFLMRGLDGSEAIIHVAQGEERPVWLTLERAEARELARGLNAELPWGDEAREALADAPVAGPKP